jgi:hypothetical protein
VGMARHRIYREPSVGAQFDAFRKAAEAAVGGCQGLLISLDSEDDATWSQVTEFEQRCYDRWGVWLVAYYPCWWLPSVGNPKIRAGCTFWHSRYSSTPGDLCGGRTTLVGQLWQYSSKGTCPGITPPVDRNWFYGTRAQLEALAVGAGAGTDGGDDELTPDEDRWLREIEQGIVVSGTTSVAQSYELLFNRVKAVNTAFAASGTTGPEQTWNILAARMANIAAGIEALSSAAPAPERTNPLPGGQS